MRQEFYFWLLQTFSVILAKLQHPCTSVFLAVKWKTSKPHSPTVHWKYEGISICEVCERCYWVQGIISENSKIILQFAYKPAFANSVSYFHCTFPLLYIEDLWY